MYLCVHVHGVDVTWWLFGGSVGGGQEKGGGGLGVVACAWTGLFTEVCG